MDFLYSPPPGFNSSVDLLNVLNLDSAQTIAYEACVSAFDKRTVIPPSRTEIDVSYSDEQISSICNALSFLYQGSLRNKINRKKVEEGLSQHTDLETNIINVIVRVYHRVSKAKLSKNKEKEDTKDEEMDEAKNILNLGRLVSMKWSMGITISSSKMRKVQKPFVRLSLQIAHGNGDIKTYFVTLSIRQFQELREEIKLTRMIMQDLD
eukprot:UN03975